MSSQTRQLTIQTGVVNRLVKELKSYIAEADKQKERVAQMEDNHDDEYEVRQQRRVLAESEQMIPDSQKRLAKAITDLDDLLASAEDELSATDEYKKAQDALTAAREQTGES
ncbi:Rbl2p [Rhodotorula paludigena]|uniref:Rbl2p n=1 Tax=Rhodotorula paludigena TaxID=86838 RepID=UPI00317A3917